MAAHPSEASKDRATLREELEGRANRLRIWAGGFLVAIVLLLGFGGVIFYQAPQITLSDITANPDLDTRLSRIRTELAAALTAVDADNKKVRDQAELFRAALAKCGTAVTSSNIDLIQIPARDFATKEAFIAALKKIAAHAPLITFDADDDPSKRILFTDDSKARCLQDLQSADIPSIEPLVAQRESDNQKLSDLGAAELDLRQTRQQREVQKITGLSLVPPNPASTSTAALIQTSVTRFGSLLIILFLVNILASLYRYNVRLAAFYHARADALALIGAEFTQTGFTRLSNALTPTLDFGKPPQTPIEQVIELAREIAASSSRKTDS